MNALPLALLLAGCALTPPPTVKIPRWLKVIWWAYFLFLVMLLTSCATPPVPPHDAAVDQAWARFLLCEQHMLKGCE